MSMPETVRLIDKNGDLWFPVGHLGTEYIRADLAVLATTHQRTLEALREAEKALAEIVYALCPDGQSFAVGEDAQDALRIANAALARIKGGDMTTDKLKELALAAKAARRLDRRQIAAREKLKHTKTCEACSSVFFREPFHTEARWQRKRFCGSACGGRQSVAESVRTDDEVREWMLANSSIDPETGCRNSRSRPDASGYPVFGWGGKKRKAHRVAYDLWCGPVPEGMLVCHRCDNRRCIEPTHLFIGTNADNTADRNAKGRQARGERSGAAKLTAEQVRSIRAMRGTHKEIAARFGVAATTIANIRNRKKWAHVEDIAA